MKRQLEQRRNWGVVLVLGLLSALAAPAASSTAYSPSITVDTRVVGIAVSGRVLDAASRAPVSGAAVSLGGQNTSSSGAGLFSFASVSASGGTLAVSKSGYASYTGTVPVPAGASAVTLLDVLLQVAPVGNKPVVTALRPAVSGLFIETVPLLNEYTAVVDWRGATPQEVEFYVNGAFVKTVPTSSTEATATLMNMGQLFSPHVSQVSLNRCVGDDLGMERRSPPPFFQNRDGRSPKSPVARTVCPFFRRF